MNSGTAKTQTGDFFKGAALKPNGQKISVFGSVKPKTRPPVKSERTTEDKDPTTGISSAQPSLGENKVNPVNCPMEKVNVNKPVCKEGPTENACEGLTLKFDSIFRQLTEADDIDDTPIGGNFDDASANLDGDEFDDDEGDLNAIDDDSDTDSDLGESAEDFLRGIRDQINDFLGEGSSEDEDSDLLDDTDTELPEEGEEEPADAAGAAAPPPPPTQNESWQHKTALGPKMSDKAPGKLGKKKGGKMGKGTLKKNVVDGKGKKVPFSKFNPRMSDKVSRLKKGDLF